MTLKKSHTQNFGLVVKEAMVEHYTCDDIALAIPTCAIASSKWNPIAGKDSCVVRILEIEELRFPPTFEKVLFHFTLLGLDF